MFSFRFENYIPAGKAKRKESQIQTFYQTSSAHFLYGQYFDLRSFVGTSKGTLLAVNNLQRD